MRRRRERFVGNSAATVGVQCSVCVDQYREQEAYQSISQSVSQIGICMAQIHTGSKRLTQYNATMKLTPKHTYTVMPLR